jgi:hypothetical protein
MKMRDGGEISEKEQGDKRGKYLEMKRLEVYHTYTYEHSRMEHTKHRKGRAEWGSK